MQRLPAITHDRFSLIRFRSPLLTESRLLSLPVGTEMFHFPTFPPHTLYIQVWVTGHVSSRVSPFGNPRITARLPAPRGLSQAPTSFIGSWCQGIHRMPLQTCHYKPTRHNNKPAGTPGPESPGTHSEQNCRRYYRCSRPLYSSQATNRHRPHTRHPPPHREQYDRRTGPPETTPRPPPTRGGPPVPSGPNSVPRPTTRTRPTRSHPTPPKTNPRRRRAVLA